MDDDQKHRHFQLISRLVEIVTELDWIIGIPARDLDKMVDGLILGTPDFVKTLSIVLYEKNMLKDINGDDIVKKKKDPTFH